MIGLSLLLLAVGGGAISVDADVPRQEGQAVSYASLREFVEALDQAGELHRVTAEVDPVLEVSEIVDRVSKSPAATSSEHAAAFDPLHHHLGGKAILFENVKGAKFPLLMNAWGSYRRIEMALGCDGDKPHGGGLEAWRKKSANWPSPSRRRS